MTSLISTSYNPVEHYREFGDNRPPAEVLEGMIDVLSNTAQTEELVVLADMHLDYAIRNPDNKDDNFSMAWENLNLVIGITDDLVENDNRDELAYIADAAVTARLRMAELETWYRAVNKEPTAIDYPAYLQAAVDSLTYMNMSQQAHSSMLEFMPVLLGARGLYLQSHMSWAGRLSLTREDERWLRGSVENPNWDCSATQDPDPKNFISPRRENRLQIKHAPIESDIRYNLAGITVISSVKAAFQNPQKLVTECADEYADDEVHSKLSDYATKYIFKKAGLRF
jgi:hypothetical protein